MTVKMILAVDRGNAIGWQDGRLPWKIPADMKRFKEFTSGHAVLMGRKTFESLGRPQGLPNRENFVLTTDMAKVVCEGGPTAVRQLQGFIEYYQRKDSDLWIIGGANVYEQAIELQLVDEIHLTLVDTNSGADVTMKSDLCDWKLFVLRQAKNGVQWNLEQISTPQKTEDNLTFTFLTLKKIQ